MTRTSLLDGAHVTASTIDEAKVLWHKTKANYYGYIAEFKTDDAKKAARASFQEAAMELAVRRDNVSVSSYKESKLIMQRLLDQFIVWDKN